MDTTHTPADRQQQEDIKRCASCGVWRPRDQYHYSSTAKDRLQGRCKLCKSIDSRLQRLRTPERLREQKKAWWERHAETLNEARKRLHQARSTADEADKK